MACPARPSAACRQTGRLAAAVLAATCSLAARAAPAASAPEPALDPVVRSVQAGRLDEARQMMERVLHEHPESAKAHYLDAEILAQQGLFGSAQDELAAAQRLAPGLPFARADDLQSLRAQLERLGGRRPPPPPQAAAAPAPGADDGVLLDLLLAVGSGGLFAWLLMRLWRQPPAPD